MVPNYTTIDLKTGLPLDVQKIADESLEKALPKDEDVDVSERLYRAFQGNRYGVWANNVQQDREFVEGKQWTQSEIEELKLRNQMATVVNMTGFCVDQSVALLTYNKPKFTATGREDSDVKVAQMFSNIMSYIWDVSIGNVELKETIKDYDIAGLGYLYAFLDPTADSGKGEILIRSLDPLSVLVDPNSKDKFFRDASSIIVASRVTPEQLQQRRPQIWQKLIHAGYNTMVYHRPGELNAGDTVIAPVFDSTTPQLDQLLRFTKIIIPHFRTLDTTTNEEHNFIMKEYQEYIERPIVILVNPQQGPRFVTKKKEVEYWFEMMQKMGNVVHQVQDMQTGEVNFAPGPEEEGSVPGSTIEIVPQKMLYAIENGIVRVVPHQDIKIMYVFSVGGVLIEKGIVPISEYPIIPLANRWNRNPYPESNVTKARPLQRELNKTRSLIQAHMANSTNVKVIVPRGSVSVEKIKEQFREPGLGVIEVDMELGTPIVVGPVPISGEAYQMEKNIKEDIQRIFSVFELMGGNSQQAPETYKGTMMVDEMGQRRIKSKREDIEDALNQLGKVVVEMVQAYWTDEKVIRLLEPDQRTQVMVLNKSIYDSYGNVIDKLNDISTGKYDITVVSGSMLPSNRWAQFEYYLKMYEMNIIDQVEMLKKTDLVDVQGVLDRHNLVQQMQQQLQDAQEQIKKMAGDLQTFERETVHANQKVQVEKFKTQLAQLMAKIKSDTDANKNQMQARLQMFQTKLDSELERQSMQAEMDGMNETE